MYTYVINYWPQMLTRVKPKCWCCVPSFEP